MGKKIQWIAYLEKVALIKIKYSPFIQLFYESRDYIDISKYSDKDLYDMFNKKKTQKNMK